MAQISNDSPFEVVCSFAKEPTLGYNLQVYAVALLGTGRLSMSFQRVHKQTADYFGLSEKEQEAVALLDGVQPKKLFKKYYHGKQELTWKKWLASVEDKLVQNHLIPDLQKANFTALEKLGDRKLFLEKDGNPMHSELTLQLDVSVLFHIRRDERGTIYFPTFKVNDEPLERVPHKNELISTNPCLFRIENQLLRVPESTDGQKLIPFANKKFIAVDREKEEQFFREFCVPLIEEEHVYAKGVEIISEKFRATPILELATNLGGDPRLSLKFTYGKKTFPYHTTKMVSVYLEKDNEKYIFHRIKRSKQWEDTKFDTLLKLGLKHDQGSLFTPKKTEENLIIWLGKNKETLVQLGFLLAQGAGDKYAFVKPEFNLSIKEKEDWFDVDIVVHFGTHTVPYKELRKLVKSGTNELTLPDGKIGLIPQEWLTRIEEIEQYNTGKGSNKLRVKHFHQHILGIESKSEKTKWIHSLSTGATKEYEVPYSFKGVLRNYQKTGFQWMNTLHQYNLGGILADDMGLGKTIQAIAFLAKVHKVGKKASQSELFGLQTHSLLVVPTSLVYNWEKELKHFCPDMTYHMHLGQKRNKSNLNPKDAHLIITTYGILRNDVELFQHSKFESILIDEGQNIKNYKSATAKAIKKLKAKSRFSLTGTPVENSLFDLWSQMDFINPDLLLSVRQFKHRYLDPIEKNFDEQKRKDLKALIAPFVLGRKKEQVASELPKKQEQVVYCDMTEAQHSLYERTKSAYRNEILDRIAKEGVQKSRMHILSGLMKLRQLANHPKLAKEEGDSGKFELIKQKLESALAGDHKILLFSQFVEHLKLVRNYLDEVGIKYCYIDGSTPGRERDTEVSRFKNNEALKVFLISLKSGGVGLNLQEADYVFMLDPWWNPAAERQAEDRAHRIGQTQKVMVYKFITKKSLEEKIVNMQARKNKLAKDIIDYEETGLKSFDTSMLEKLLN